MSIYLVLALVVILAPTAFAAAVETTAWVTGKTLVLSWAAVSSTVRVGWKLTKAAFVAALWLLPSAWLALMVWQLVSTGHGQ